MEQRKTGWKRLSGNAIKIIAIVTMFIDHIGAIIIEPWLMRNSADAILNTPELLRWYQIDMGLRMIGRIAFPIFCFLLVEGFLHTKDVKKYALRLLAFAFISEIPFNLALAGTWFSLQYQNVYFTLFLGLLAMIGIRHFQDSRWKQALVLAGGCLAAMLLKTDYAAFGVLLIVLLYITRNDKRMQTLLGCLSVAWEITAPLAFIPITMYDGTRGKWNFKYLFYVFYPVHILLLWAVRTIWIG